MSDDEVMLAQVNSAIADLLGVNIQSYTTPSRTVQKLSLKDLYAMRQQLQWSVARQQGSGVGVAQFRDPE